MKPSGGTLGRRLVPSSPEGALETEKRFFYPDPLRPRAGKIFRLLEGRSAPFNAPLHADSQRFVAGFPQAGPETDLLARVSNLFWGEILELLR